MKVVLILIFSTIILNSAAAQTLSVTNFTDCDMVFQVYARDANTMPATLCIDYLTTFSTSALNNSDPTVYNLPGSFSWINNTPPTTAPIVYNAFIVNFDPNNLNTCFTSTGWLVGRPSCGYSQFITLPLCSQSPCNTAVNVSWAQIGPTSWELKFY